MAVAPTGSAEGARSEPTSSTLATSGAEPSTATVDARGSAESTRSGIATGSPLVFAIISDFGEPGEHEAEVARLVATWRPRFVVSAGDNYHPDAGGRYLSRYDRSLGTYYRYWVKRETTSTTAGSELQRTVNAFFPALGNHDYRDATPAPRTYLEYFDLPGAGFTSTSGNERYYDFVQGPIHFFVLDSNPEAPGAERPNSAQGQWLQRQLAASTSTWNIVVMHHPPYSSGHLHGSATYMRWPYAEWGADAVIAGHAHVYERIMRDGIVYFVNGLGGEGDRDYFDRARTGTAKRYRDGRGAQKVTVTPEAMVFEFFNSRGVLIDSYRLPAAARTRGE